MKTQMELRVEREVEARLRAEYGLPPKAEEPTQAASEGTKAEPQLDLSPSAVYERRRAIYEAAARNGVR